MWPTAFIEIKVDFLPADKRQRCPQIDSIIFGMCVTRHVQITQNNKFTISLQYMSDEVDFSRANKHEILLQIATMILREMVEHSQSSRNSKFAISLQYLKKEVRNGVHFLHADKHQSFYELALLFLMEVARDVQSPKIGSW